MQSKDPVEKTYKRPSWVKTWRGGTLSWVLQSRWRSWSI